MKNAPLLMLICIMTLTVSCAQQNQLQQLDFLTGTWKIEGRESYESWKKEGDRLIGEAYQTKEGQKKISETLEIKIDTGRVIYTATVLNQNQGKGIPFTLNPAEKELYSFENPEHDFPNKIQYKVVTDKELKVSVLGKDGKGFSYTMRKQQ